MKHKIKLIVLLTTGIMSGAFADTSRSCPQPSTKFLELAKDYSACNSVVGSDENACNRFCEESEKLLSNGNMTSGPVQQICSADQIRSAQAQARQDGMNQGMQQGRDEVLRDLSVKEDFVSVDYYGENEADCARRVNQSSQGLRVEAVKRCNARAASIRNCFIKEEKVIGAFGRPPKFTGEANFKREDNRSTQEECQSTALTQASAQAAEKCRTSTGETCSIIPQETILTHRLQAPGGLRMGRRDSRVCDAKVVFEAPAGLNFKCNMRISARNQAFAN
jgi:hypothetical protein